MSSGVFQIHRTGTQIEIPVSGVGHRDRNLGPRRVDAVCICQDPALADCPFSSRILSCRGSLLSCSLSGRLPGLLRLLLTCSLAGLLCLLLTCSLSGLLRLLLTCCLAGLLCLLLTCCLAGLLLHGACLWYRSRIHSLLFIDHGFRRSLSPVFSRCLRGLGWCLPAAAVSCVRSP